jgi:hypothetical protein
MPLFQAPPPPESVAGDFNQLGDFVGFPIVLRPDSSDRIDTSNGPSDIIRAEGWVWNAETKTLDELGEVTVFWVKVRAQLGGMVGTGNAVSGRIKRQGRAYVFEDLDVDTEDQIAKAYEKFDK